MQQCLGDYLTLYNDFFILYTRPSMVLLFLLVAIRRSPGQVVLRKAVFTSICPNPKLYIATINQNTCMMEVCLTADENIFLWYTD